MRLRYERDADGNLRERFGAEGVPDLVVEELPHDIVADLLATQPVARIALRVAGRVHIVPVNHLVDDDGTIAFRTARGRKLDLAQRSAPIAVLEADHALERLPGWYAVVVGQLVPVLDMTEVARLERSELRTYADADPERREHWLRLRPTVGRAYRVSDAATASPRALPDLAPSPQPKPGQGRLEELTEAECRVVVAETHVGRLARIVGNQPHLTPVLYDATGDTLLIRTVMGERIDAIGPDEQVVLEVDVVDESAWSGRSVLVEGTLDRLQVRGGRASPPADPTSPFAFPVPTDQLLQLSIGSMTGRRIVRE